jgi:hypothetical protein
MKNKPWTLFVLLKHVVSGSDKTKRWPKAGRSSAPAFIEGFGITANEMVFV